MTVCQMVNNIQSQPNWVHMLDTHPQYQKYCEGSDTFKHKILGSHISTVVTMVLASELAK